MDGSASFICTVGFTDEMLPKCKTIVADLFPQILVFLTIITVDECRNLSKFTKGYMLNLTNTLYTVRLSKVQQIHIISQTPFQNEYLPFSWDVHINIFSCFVLHVENYLKQKHTLVKQCLRGRYV